jgi:hypothetical protein
VIKKSKVFSKLPMRQALSSGPFGGRLFVVVVSFVLVALLVNVQLGKLGENADHARELARELHQDYMSRNRFMLERTSANELDDSTARIVVQR